MQPIIKLRYTSFFEMRDFLKKYFHFLKRPVIVDTTIQTLLAGKAKGKERPAMHLHIKHLFSLLLLSVLLLSGCGQTVSAAERAAAPSFLGATLLAGESPAIDAALATSAPGTLVKKNAKAVVDYSNTADGYVMVQYTASTAKRLKVKVLGPLTADGYTYNITPGAWVTFPLSDGNGSYQVTVYENVSASKYAPVLSANFTVALTDEFAPFLHANQYVNFENAPKTIAKAKELTKGKTAALEQVAAVYDYVVKTITYDKKQAAAVQSGYLPVLDSVLDKKTGICFDYAALMTGMLRSQGVPCKLVVGYAGTAYHAWINVWSEETGWIENAVYFDGVSWQRMDPTFASSGKESASILKYIGDGAHYTVKYLY